MEDVKTVNKNSDKTVLLVDDTTANLELLISVLSQKGYKTLIAKNGQTAIKRAVHAVPDLILLDIQMPGIDGFETCRQLKVKEETKEIPVIFMTALTDTNDKLRGFEAGGVDYITKPIDCVELLARVDTHISLHRARHKLIKQNEILKENALLRESMEQIMRHDLKSPLTGLIMIPQVILGKKNLTDQQVQLLNSMQKAGMNMLQMINRSMDIFRMEKKMYKPQLNEVDIFSVLREVSDVLKMSDENEHDTLFFFNGVPASREDHCLIQSEEMLLFSLFSNLLKNAYEASSESQPVKVSLSCGDEVLISIENFGSVPETIRETFFDKFVTSGKNKGSGLGTYSAKLIVTTLKGTIELDSSIEGKTAINIVFPRDSQKAEQNSA